MDDTPVSVKWEKSALTSPDSLPQKASVQILMLTMEDGLKRLNLKDENGLAKNFTPLLNTIKDTINTLEENFGAGVAERAIATLKQAVTQKGMGEGNLGATFSRLLASISNDENLKAQNLALTEKITGQLPEENQWAGQGLLTLWNAGVNANRKQNSKLANGQGEYWAGEDGLKLRNQSEKGLAAAMRDFYGKPVVNSGDTFKSAKIFSAAPADSLFANAQINYQTVKWLEAANTQVAPGIAIDNQRTGARGILAAVKSEDLAPQIEKAAKFLIEEIGSQKAAKILQSGNVRFTDAALQSLQAVKEEKGNQAAAKAVNFFNQVFVSAINEAAVYDDKTNNTYGGKLLFTGFSVSVDDEVFDTAEKLGLGEQAGPLPLGNLINEENKPESASPFFANWGYMENPETGHMCAAGYIGLGENQFYFNGGTGIKQLAARLLAEAQAAARAEAGQAGEAGNGHAPNEAGARPTTGNLTENASAGLAKLRAFSAYPQAQNTGRYGQTLPALFSQLA